MKYQAKLCWNPVDVSGTFSGSQVRSFPDSQILRFSDSQILSISLCCNSQKYMNHQILLVYSTKQNEQSEFCQLLFKLLDNSPLFSSAAHTFVRSFGGKEIFSRTKQNKTKLTATPRLLDSIINNKRKIK